MNVAINMYQNLKGDRTIWVVVALLAVFSMLAVYSATGSMAYRSSGASPQLMMIKHLMIIGMGLTLTYLAYLQHYMKYSRLAPILLLIAVPLLLYTLFFTVHGRFQFFS